MGIAEASADQAVAFVAEHPSAADDTGPLMRRHSDRAVGNVPSTEAIVNRDVLPAQAGPADAGSKMPVRQRMQGWLVGVPTSARCWITPRGAGPASLLIPDRWGARQRR